MANTLNIIKEFIEREELIETLESNLSPNTAEEITKPNMTVHPVVRRVERWWYWPQGARLVFMEVIKEDNQPPVPVPEGQPSERAVTWNKTRLLFYCNEHEKDKFTKYFLDTGCTISNIRSFIKSVKTCYELDWKFDMIQTDRDSVIRREYHGSCDKCECYKERSFVYYQVELNELTGELTPSKIQNLFIYCNMYYDFKNVSKILTRSADYDNLEQYTRENPLHLPCWFRQVPVLLEAIDPEQPVSYKGYALPADRDNEIQWSLEWC